LAGAPSWPSLAPDFVLAFFVVLSATSYSLQPLGPLLFALNIE
jgi:hypothetical protein